MQGSDSPWAADQPLLTMKGVSKSFPGVQALANVDLELYPGEVLALLGENGAGKSTLIKILGGVHTPDSGSIEIGGTTVEMDSPLTAQRAGVGIIYQEFNLVPALSARENIFLGQEGSMVSWIDSKQERQKATALFDRIGTQVDPDQLCRNLTVAQQQIVEIAKALALNARIVVMDEPSAALTPREVEGLYEIVDELRSQGIGIIYISHRLDEIDRLADRIMILRDGEQVGTRSASELDRSQMIEMMVGRSLQNEFPQRDTQVGEDRLVLKGLSRGRAVQDVSFAVKRGEILGLAGLVGAGRTETVRLLFGADKLEAGTVTLDGRALIPKSPRQMIGNGICLLTEDRKHQGLVLGLSVQENFGLPNMNDFAVAGFIAKKSETTAFEKYVEQMTIRVTGGSQLAATLSGGNQQKLVLAKWLQRNAEVVIFDEPTRGIDVGAKYEIYQLLNELAAQGKAIIMISSELPEILGMSDRIVVMREGQVAGCLVNEGISQEDIMRLATGSEVTVALENQLDSLEKSLGEQATGADASGTDEKRSLGDQLTIGKGDGDPSETLDLPLIDLAARYEIERELGQGGMGSVLLATDRQLKRKVAIKRIHGSMSKSKTALQRFVTEAQAIAALNHFNIVQVYEFGRDAEGPLLVLEYVEGGSLLDKLKTGKLEVEEAIDITCKLCDALGKVHDVGTIHRDIKPANILLTEDGVPKLTDFGLARQDTADNGQTQEGAVLGTPDYMPPEQRRDATAVDARSDLYSLAATFYQMVTGKSPGKINFKNVPTSLQDMLEKALEEEQDDRYQTAQEFRDALKGGLQGQGEF